MLHSLACSLFTVHIVLIPLIKILNFAISYRYYAWGERVKGSTILREYEVNIAILPDGHDDGIYNEVEIKFTCTLFFSRFR